MPQSTTMPGAAPGVPDGSGTTILQYLVAASGAEQRRSGAVFRRRQRVAGQIRSAAILGTDLCAVVVANVLALLLARKSLATIVETAAANSSREGLAWHAWGLGLITMVFCAHLFGRGHYRLRITFWVQALDVTTACLLAFLCDLVLTACIYREPVGAATVFRWLLLSFLILAGRAVMRSALDRVGLWQLKTLIVGDGRFAERARAVLTADLSMGYTIVGSIAAHVTAPWRTAEDWYALMADRGADFLVVAGGDDTGQRDSELLAALSLTRIPLTFIPPFASIPVVGCESQHVHRHDVMLMTSQPRWNEPISHALKAILDYGVAAALGLCLSPLLGLIAVAVSRDGGPVLYRQSRIGANGHAFQCLKFRTMAVDADDLLADLLRSDPGAAQEWAANRKLARDPRITPIGRLLRETSLDELPQFWNVLRGEMSLVGPRPIVAAEVALYGQWMRFYTHMKPGMTGLWQVSGRSRTSYSQRVALDVWYARNWNLWQDIAIILMTVPALLFRRGAV